jgi:hypothetical protein
MSHRYALRPWAFDFDFVVPRSPQIIYIDIYSQ